MPCHLRAKITFTLPIVTFSTVMFCVKQHLTSFKISTFLLLLYSYSNVVNSDMNEMNFCTQFYSFNGRVCMQCHDLIMYTVKTTLLLNTQYSSFVQLYTVSCLSQPLAIESVYLYETVYTSAVPIK